MNRLSRRHLLGALPLAAMGTGAFYRIGTVKGRQCFVDPAGRPFFSIGMNHIDSAPLRSDETWRREFGDDTQRWLKAVRADLVAWGFNSVGWVQEYVSISHQHHRLSRSFTPEEYRWLNMPYGHLLPFIESHQWEIETRLPKLDSPGFAEWCDYVARDQCVRFRDDPRLIVGAARCLTPRIWRQPKAAQNSSAWRPTTIARSTRPSAATDPNHLILGDRYEARAPLPEEVVRAALPFVDVLSFQCFAPPAEIRATLQRWASFSGKPVLLADAGHWTQPFTPIWPPPADRQHDAALYAETLNNLLDLPACVGYHLCGAYLENNTRRYGFRDAQNRLEPHVAAMARANHVALSRFRKQMA